MPAVNETKKAKTNRQCNLPLKYHPYEDFIPEDYNVDEVGIRNNLK